MQHLQFPDFLQSISVQRLRPYLQRVAGSELQTYALYAWNIALSESFYPALNGIEITLRNSIHNSAVDQFGDEYWFDKLKLDKTKDALEKARRELKRIHKGLESFTAGQLVAQLTFGFWVGLFDSKYEQILWTKLLKTVFPGIPRGQRKRSLLANRLHRIRLIRNRIFHHEPIWYREDLNRIHDEILETIGWINLEMMRFVTALDRFPKVYAGGPQFYEEELMKVYQAKSDT